MFFKRKKDDVQIEKFEGFRTQTTFGCKGQLKTQFFDLEKPVDEELIEYLKPFGHPILLGGRMYEIRREGFFRLLLTPGTNTFHARFVKNCDPKIRDLLTRQVFRAINGNDQGELPSRCPEGAISVNRENGSKISIDLKKCTFCLECI